MYHFCSCFGLSFVSKALIYLYFHLTHLCMFPGSPKIQIFFLLRFDFLRSCQPRLTRLFSILLERPSHNNLSCYSPLHLTFPSFSLFSLPFNFPFRLQHRSCQVPFRFPPSGNPFPRFSFTYHKTSDCFHINLLAIGSSWLFDVL